MITYLEEVEKKLIGQKRKNPFVVSVYNTKSEVLAIPVPIQRDIAKKGFSFSSKDSKILMKIWEFIWSKSNIFEVRGQSLYYFELQKKNPDFIKNFTTLRFFVKGLNNWAHSDMLSDIFSRFLEEDFKKISPVLSKWNKSKNPWMKRQSIVSLFYYQRMRSKYPPLDFVVSMIIPLIKDSDYYVQKGLGWTLREAIQVYPKEINGLIRKYLHQLSPVAFTTVCEKIEEPQKNKYKLLRRKLRRKNL